MQHCTSWQFTQSGAHLSLQPPLVLFDWIPARARTRHFLLMHASPVVSFKDRRSGLEVVLWLRFECCCPRIPPSSLSFRFVLHSFLHRFPLISFRAWTADALFFRFIPHINHMLYYGLDLALSINSNATQPANCNLSAGMHPSNFTRQIRLRKRIFDVFSTIISNNVRAPNLFFPTLHYEEQC